MRNSIKLVQVSGSEMESVGDVDSAPSSVSVSVSVSLRYRIFRCCLDLEGRLNEESQRVFLPCYIPTIQHAIRHTINGVEN